MAAADAAPETPERKRDRLMRAMRVPLAVRTSDLPKRAASAVVMLAVVALVFWIGSPAIEILIAAVSLVCFWEWQRLVRTRPLRPFARGIWLAGGVLYIGLAAWLLLEMPISLFPLILGVVIFTDSCAYFSGRTFGGPKIAPRISPSKTWAGLFGGMAGAGVFLWLAMTAFTVDGPHSDLPFAQALFTPWGLSALPLGAGLAVAAQAGDFFESWMKRKAAMKDSSGLIPGHGGVFDRIDGLLPVSILVGLLFRYVL